MEIAIVFKQTDAYTEIWNDQGSRGDQDVAFWRVNNFQSEFCSLGDIAVANYELPTYKGLLVSERKSGALVHPTGPVCQCSTLMSMVKRPLQYIIV